MPINDLAPAPQLPEMAAMQDDSSKVRDQYQAAERDFSSSDFCGVNLQGSCLSYINFRRSKLKQVDLSDANLWGIDLSEADLSRSNLQNADLRGAALDRSMLFMATLDGANLQGADLSSASLDITTLAQANLRGANLCGTYLRGIDLSEAELQGAFFDARTQFEAGFDPLAAGMRTQTTMPIGAILAHLNQVSQATSRYLGGTMTSRYWEKARIDVRQLANFTVASNGKIHYGGDQAEVASLAHLKWTQLWLNRFIGNGALIFQDLPNIAEAQSLLVIVRD
jgi:hypothetical protein